MTASGAVRVAALADLHHAKGPRGALQPLRTALAEAADVVLLCGDLTHHGRVEEAAALAEEWSGFEIPTLAVLGNHDCHAAEEDRIRRVLGEVGIHVLDGDMVEIQGIGFAGVKGFAGGFGRHLLEPWGENVIKTFVHEAVNEALKLETALAHLTTSRRVVLMHYSPIRETVEGEPLEIHPFLGSSRLEEPINRFHCAAVFHGHAHHGFPEGRTSTGIPVHNVSIPLLRSLSPERPPFRVLEFDPEAPDPVPTAR